MLLLLLLLLLLLAHVPHCLDGVCHVDVLAHGSSATHARELVTGQGAVVKLALKKVQHLEHVRGLCDGSDGTHGCARTAADARRFRKQLAHDGRHRLVRAPRGNAEDVHALELLARTDAARAQDALVEVELNGRGGVVVRVADGRGAVLVLNKVRLSHLVPHQQVLYVGAKGSKRRGGE